MPTFSEAYYDELLLESGFSRIAQIMSGLVPNVKTFAILTWENPMGKQLSNEENRIRNNELKDLLKRGAYGFRQIHGKYGNFENPFFIMNVTEQEAMECGITGKQESILFGNIEGPFDIVFKMKFCFENKEFERHVWKSLDKGVDNYFSEYKGRKFYIPFFDDDGKFVNGKIEKEDYNIFYAKDFNKIIVDKIEQDAIDLLDESFSEKHHFLTRGLIFEDLKRNKNVNTRTN